MTGMGRWGGCESIVCLVDPVGSLNEVFVGSVWLGFLCEVVLFQEFCQVGEGRVCAWGVVGILCGYRVRCMFFRGGSRHCDTCV